MKAKYGGLEVSDARRLRPKCVDHLSPYRQPQFDAREGVEISRSTMIGQGSQAGCCTAGGPDRRSRYGQRHTSRW